MHRLQFVYLVALIVSTFLAVDHQTRIIAKGEQTVYPPHQLQHSGHQATRPTWSDWVANRTKIVCRHQAVNDGLDRRPHKSGKPVGHNPHSRVCNTLIGFRVDEVFRLIAMDEGIEVGFAFRDVTQPHSLADTDPEVEPSALLVLGHTPTAVAIGPSDGEFDEGPEHEKKVIVWNSVMTMGLVHALQGLVTELAIPARLDKVADKDRGIVVALLPKLLELSSAVQQA
ncbi:hypothetical protein D9M71_402470 [compost metagenome]